MIEHAHGNILEANVEALVNTVNTVGVMGKGIALQFRQAFPGNYAAYRAACKHNEVKPGSMLVYQTGRFENPHFIFNFPTKRHWKGKSKIEDIEAGLVDLVRVVRYYQVRSLAVPPLGCGNGGLDWSVVRPMIERALAELNDVKVLVFAPEGAPPPEEMVVRTDAPRMSDGRAAIIGAMLAYAESGYRLSLLEIQKLAYLLQEAGEPLRLKFVRDKYGPYAEALNHVLQRIEGHFIRGYGDRASDASIRVLPQGEAATREYLIHKPETRARIDRVVQLIEGFETPRGLELLATVDWLSKEDPQVRDDPKRAIASVHEWSDHKRKAFPAPHIEVAWRQLSECGWFASMGPGAGQ
jgi:O-acetyl-ADP-ribose deacetylase (regulator of RNase III)